MILVLQQSLRVYSTSIFQFLLTFYLILLEERYWLSRYVPNTIDNLTCQYDIIHWHIYYSCQILVVANVWEVNFICLLYLKQRVWKIPLQNLRRLLPCSESIAARFKSESWMQVRPSSYHRTPINLNLFTVLLKKSFFVAHYILL